MNWEIPKTRYMTRAPRKIRNQQLEQNFFCIIFPSAVGVLNPFLKMKSPLTKTQKANLRKRVALKKLKLWAKQVKKDPKTNMVAEVDEISFQLRSPSNEDRPLRNYEEQDSERRIKSSRTYDRSESFGIIPLSLPFLSRVELHQASRPRNDDGRVWTSDRSEPDGIIPLPPDCFCRVERNQACNGKCTQYGVEASRPWNDDGRVWTSDRSKPTGIIALPLDCSCRDGRHQACNERRNHHWVQSSRHDRRNWTLGEDEANWPEAWDTSCYFGKWTREANRLESWETATAPSDRPEDSTQGDRGKSQRDSRWEHRHHVVKMSRYVLRDWEERAPDQESREPQRPCDPVSPCHDVDEHNLSVLETLGFGDLRMQRCAVQNPISFHFNLPDFLVPFESWKPHSDLNLDRNQSQQLNPDQSQSQNNNSDLNLGQNQQQGPNREQLQILDQNQDQNQNQGKPQDDSSSDLSVDETPVVFCLMIRAHEGVEPEGALIPAIHPEIMEDDDDIPIPDDSQLVVREVTKDFLPNPSDVYPELDRLSSQEAALGQTAEQHAARLENIEKHLHDGNLNQAWASIRKLEEEMEHAATMAGSLAHVAELHDSSLIDLRSHFSQVATQDREWQLAMENQWSQNLQRQEGLFQKIENFISGQKSEFAEFRGQFSVLENKVNVQQHHILNLQTNRSVETQNITDLVQGLNAQVRTIMGATEALTSRNESAAQLTVHVEAQHSKLQSLQALTAELQQQLQTLSNRQSNAAIDATLWQRLQHLEQAQDTHEKTLSGPFEMLRCNVDALRVELNRSVAEQVSMRTEMNLLREDYICVRRDLEAAKRDLNMQRAVEKGDSMDSAFPSQQQKNAEMSPKLLKNQAPPVRVNISMLPDIQSKVSGFEATLGSVL